MNNRGTIKAVGLLSGGLDSTLAVKLMMDQEMDVTVLNFVTPFCTNKGNNNIRNIRQPEY